MSEQIGKHKGAVETLLHEKKELSRILQIVNSQLQRHLSALEEAGIDTDEFIESVQEGAQQMEQKQSQKRKQKEQSRTQERQERSSNRRQERNRTQESENPEEETDTDELLESDNDVGNRDFNPNR